MKVAAHSTKERFEELTNKITSLLAAGDVAPGTVHRLRTTARRIESVLRFHDPAEDGATRKTLSRLAKLRKSAGRVRDLDVMRNLLDSVDCDSAGERKRVESAIETERKRRAAKLATAISKQAEKDLRTRLGKLRAPQDLMLDFADSYVQGAANQFMKDASSFEHLDEHNLHDFRMVCKRARYVAELAGDNEVAEGLRTELKKMQDAIGEWHDWVQLSGVASRVLPGRTSRLLLAIRTTRRTKFNNALTVTVRGREQVAFVYQSRVSASSRKPSMGVYGKGHAGTGLRLVK